MHRDLQPFLLTLSDAGAVRVLGLAVSADEVDMAPAPGGGVGGEALRQSRDDAERDVLAMAVVLHGLLAGAPALEQPDAARVIAQLPPSGRETLRLPWDLPRLVPDPLRTVANRATDRQPRQRYRNARTLARALEGWLEADASQAVDAHEQLIDRVRQIGALPALPGRAERAARLALMERQHTEELSQVVLRDPALTFELLRNVNSAQARHPGVGQWPGADDPPRDRDGRPGRRAPRRAQPARLARGLRPAGYDAEVVSLVALIQNLGRLVVQYHYADEMAQVRRLMQPVVLPGAEPGAAPEPGMSEQGAAYAVLGADIEGMGAAVARRWAMDAVVLHMMPRLPTEVPVRPVETDDDMLRAVASAANEAVDALTVSAQQQTAAVNRVAMRCARAFSITARDLQSALQASALAGSAPTDHDDGDAQDAA